MADEGNGRRARRRRGMSLRISLPSPPPPPHSLPFPDCGGGGGSSSGDRQPYFHYHPMYNPFFPTYFTPPSHADIFNSPAAEEESGTPPFPATLPGFNSDSETPEYIPSSDSTPPPWIRLQEEQQEDDRSPPETPPGIRRRPGESPLESGSFRYPVEDNAEGFNVDELLASPATDQLHSDIMRSHSSLDMDAIKRKTGTGCCSKKGAEKDKGMNKNEAYFECNICYALARDPVVTSCGHLFCWPCLYRSLHVRSHDDECPTCKCKVYDCDVTPIYGRGDLDEGEESKGSYSQSGLSIPPRPHGNRIEGWRQQLTPEVIRERADVLLAWFNSRVHMMESRMGRQAGFVNSSNQGAVGQEEAGYDTRNVRTRPNMVGERNNSSSIDTAALNNDSAPSNQQHNILNFPLPNVRDMWEPFTSALYGQIHAGGTSQFETPTAVPAVPYPQPVWHAVDSATIGDQASTSSTMAVIEGDFAHIVGLPDPNSAGSSRPFRRRGARETTSVSQAADMEESPRRRRRH